jgi:hypothetical protein
MTQENAKIIADYLLGETEYEMAATRRVFAAVPADANYKPSDKCMNGLKLAGHIAVCEVFFLSGVLNGKFEWAPLEFKTPAEALPIRNGKCLNCLPPPATCPAKSSPKPLPWGR